mmetsp:Transcript_64792/g.76709  ORF Transcript_64792/g.76709 Transcript_64792/m.76709 type:complete len:338 (+) Transcript_64792:196-1209(+)
MDFFRSAVWKVPFDILHRSRENGLSSYCHTALSFLAPAEKVITLLPEDEVELTIENTIKTISTKIIKQTQAQINMTNPTLSPSVFLYSLGDDDGADSDTVAPSLSSSKDYLRDIACGTGGIWTHVPPGGDLTSAMANYYQRIAASATSAITTIYDDDDTTPVVAWSMTDPSYTVTNHSLTAASGSISADVGGGSHAALTVSAPVYDRAVTPPVLIGVAGITDFIELDASGGDVVGSAHFETLERLLIDCASHSTRNNCPKRTITKCNVQNLRSKADGYKASCDSSDCQSFTGNSTVRGRELLCGDETSHEVHPLNFWGLWENTINGDECTRNESVMK